MPTLTTLPLLLQTIELALTQLGQGSTRRVDVVLDDGVVIKVYQVSTLIRIDISGYGA